MLGALPTLDTLMIERFFDESGGMQLVLHAPFGVREPGVARAAQALLPSVQLRSRQRPPRMRFLSLGPQHSFLLG